MQKDLRFQQTIIVAMQLKMDAYRNLHLVVFKHSIKPISCMDVLLRLFESI